MRNKHASVTLSGGQILIGVDCTQCGTTHEFTVPMVNYDLWVNGELVQKAFPEIAREKRELLVSGTCGACFKKMFANC